MTKKEEFKLFVKKNPVLLKHVKNGTMTWQKFYEIYDLYGTDENAWKDYLKVGVAATSAFDFASMFKNIDLDSIQKGVNSLQRVVGVFQDMGNNKKTKPEKNKPRPLYKHFDD